MGARIAAAVASAPPAAPPQAGWCGTFRARHARPPDAARSSGVEGERAEGAPVVASERAGETTRCDGFQREHPMTTNTRLIDAIASTRDLSVAADANPATRRSSPVPTGRARCPRAHPPRLARATHSHGDRLHDTSITDKHRHAFRTMTSGTPALRRRVLDLPIPPRCRDLIERGALVAVNSSGGKDSQAMCILLSRIVPLDQLLVVHAPLGDVEWPHTIEHVQRTIPPGVPLILATVASGKSLLERVEHRGRWMGVRQRFCTSEHETGPIERELRRYLKAHPRYEGRLVNALGFPRVSLGFDRRPSVVTVEAFL